MFALQTDKFGSHNAGYSARHTTMSGCFLPITLSDNWGQTQDQIEPRFPSLKVKLALMDKLRHHLLKSFQ